MTYPPQQPPTGPQQQPYGTQPGYPVQQPYGQPMPGQYPPQPPKKSKAWLWVSLIAAPILLCGGCFGLVSVASNSNDDTSSSSIGAPGAQDAPKASGRGKNVAAAGSAVRDGKFEFQVTAVEAPVTNLGSGYRAVTAKGEFIVIRLDVTNTGNEPRNYNDSNQKLFDEQGREFANSSAGVRAAGSDDWELDLNPGFKIQVALVFDVPVGTVPTTLELHDSILSGGVKVALK